MISFPLGRVRRAPFASALIFAILFVTACAHHAATANIPAPPATATSPAAAPATPATPSAKTNPSSGGASKKPPRGAAPSAPAVGAPGGPAYVEEGVASWYGFPFQGRRASDGEIYDMNQMVAAHRTLPFNTIVRVTNLRNGLQTEVRIIDRGPFVEGRIIDLSLAAAKTLDIWANGTAPVRLEIVSAGPVLSPSGAPLVSTDVTVGVFAVQIGAFADVAKANHLRDQLTANYPSVSVQKFDLPTGTVYRVFVGRYTFEAAAQEIAVQIQAEHGYAAFVVRVDPVPQPDSLKK